MNKTTYKISKMDCASEENIVRMKLEGFQNIKAMQFDIPKRKLNVIHDGIAEPITAAIESFSVLAGSSALFLPIKKIVPAGFAVCRHCVEQQPHGKAAINHNNL